MSCPKDRLDALADDVLELLQRHAPGLCVDCVSGAFIDAAALAIADTAAAHGADPHAQTEDRCELLREAVQMRMRDIRH